MEVKMRCNCAPTHVSDAEPKRRACGCLRTCDKVKALLEKFPSPAPPASAIYTFPITTNMNTVTTGVTTAFKKLTDVIPKCCDDIYNSIKPAAQNYITEKCSQPGNNRKQEANTVLTEIGQLLQLSITASALILYYLIYCYMQLVYFTLRSALFFHNADGPMKVTIAVVLLSTVIVGINLFIRIERIIGIIY